MQENKDVFNLGVTINQNESLSFPKYIYDNILTPTEIYLLDFIRRK